MWLVIGLGMVASNVDVPFPHPKVMGYALFAVRCPHAPAHFLPRSVVILPFGFCFPVDSLQLWFLPIGICPLILSRGFDRTFLPPISPVVSFLSFLSLGVRFLMDLTIKLCCPIPCCFLSMGSSFLNFVSPLVSRQGSATRFSFGFCPLVSVL